jgi:beta-1,4-N-acetylglucosaminyltransferase
MKICIVTSPGGHLYQSFLLKKWWQEHDRVWVTNSSPDTEFLLQNEEVFFGSGPNYRNAFVFFKNFFLALRIFFKEKPDVLFSTGSGIAVPFFWLLRFFGTQTIYLEPYDFIVEPSLTARLVAPFSDIFLSQHRTLKIKKSQYWGDVFSEKNLVFGKKTTKKKKNQVFVTVGTTSHPFPRLIQQVIQLAKLYPKKTFFVQAGVFKNTRNLPKNILLQDFLSFSEVQKLLQESEIIISHAGMGTVLQSLMNGQKPVVIPRRKKHGEHVNDHQITISKFLSGNQKVTLLDNPSDLDDFFATLDL